MGKLDDIREGLRVRLATISGLQASAKAPGVVVLPAAFPIPGSIEYDETMGSNVTDYHLRIRLLIQRATETYAQEDLDPYLAPSGSSSIRAAINGDQTLGSKADWTRVARVARYGEVEHAGLSYLGAEFDVEVNADGA